MDKAPVSNCNEAALNITAFRLSAGSFDAGCGGGGVGVTEAKNNLHIHGNRNMQIFST